jgi:cobalt-zinc-cadmium efflux system outer membrane protein
MRALLLVPLLGAAACASTSPAPAFRNVAQRVARQSGHAVHWRQVTPEDGHVDDAVRALISRALSVDATVQVTLLRNRTLVATYEELGIAQADLVQAGLLRNPVLSAGIAEAELDILSPPVVVGIAQDFLDLLMLPARKTIARAQLEATELRVTDEVLGVAAQARSAYFSLQAAQQAAAMRGVIADAAGAALTAAEAQRDAGNLSDLDYETQRGLAEQARLDVAREEAGVLQMRERLTRVMGLWGPETRFVVPPKLPVLPAIDPPLEHLESLAVGQRSDLVAMRREVQVIGHVLSLAKSTRWTGALTVGLDVARLNDGRYSLGPYASIELPLFDRRQALVARLEAMQRQSEARLEGRAVEARSEVREVRARLVSARGIAERYRTVVIPLRERVVELAQERYDAMLLGVYELLLAKQNEVAAYRDYIDAVRDYWIARSDLERAVGGRLGLWPDTKEGATQ